jgi:antibiotic biosynthesis monooxygenase (ABM) superfamily enzyme
MVLWVVQYSVRPEREAEFVEWAKSAIARLLETPGLVEFRSFRPVTGDSQIASTYEFADLASWVEWHSSETMQQILQEVRAYTVNFSAELWGPSPMVPTPLRPGS